MLDYQQRVVDEKIQLDERLEKLREFMKGNFFKKVKEEEQKRMMRQEASMDIYSDVLGERIAAFSQE
jgi:hypothetical protein